MRGYSLLEVLVATTIVVVGVAALAQLIALATSTSLRARQTTMAAVLAQQKMEELLPQATTELTPSPADALVRDVEGYSDFVEGSGRSLGSGPAPPAGSAFLRRWSMDRRPDARNNTWMLQVLVTDLRSRVLARLITTKAGHAF
jgi:prepilin-type N-terminal cleavage/methylation domain-containing protein